MTGASDRPLHLGKQVAARVDEQLAKDLRVLAWSYGTTKVSDIVKRAVRQAADSVRQQWQEED
jgi:hypothetical protein